MTISKVVLVNIAILTTNIPGIPVIPVLKNPKIIAFINDLFSVTGQFMSVEWKRELKVRAAFRGVNLQKHVKGVFRAGIEYDNKGSVIAKRDSGILPKENAGLPWGEWFVYPYLVIHKGELYVRLYPTPNCHIESHILLNGAIVNFDQISHMVLASEYPKDEAPETICVNLRNLVL